MQANAINVYFANGLKNSFRVFAKVKIAMKYMQELKIKYQLIFSPKKKVVNTIGIGANGRFEKRGNQDW